MGGWGFRPIKDGKINKSNTTLLEKQGVGGQGLNYS